MIETKNDNDLKYLEEEKIYPNPLNHFEINDIADMANSIRSYGIVTPLTVIGPDDNGNYMLIAGERRLTAFREIRKQGFVKDGILPCYIIGTIDMSKTEQELLIEVSNIDSRDIANKQSHYMNVVRLIKKMVDEEGLSKREEVKLRKEYMRGSERYARFYAQVFNSGNETLQQMVEQNNISISRAGRLASLPRELQDQAIQEIKDGVNQDKVATKYNKLYREQQKDNTNESENGSESVEDLIEPPARSIEEAPIIETPEPEPDYEEEEDLDAMWDELGVDCFNSDSLTLDTTQSLNRYKEQTGMSGKEELDVVLNWCAKIRKASSLTEAEWEAVDACKKVVEKFCI